MPTFVVAMNYIRTYWQASVVMLLLNFKIFAQTTVPDGTHMTLPEVWAKAIANNKQLRVRQLQLESSKEEIKDALAERLPEIGIDAEYARISNLPIFEKGLFHAPEQFPVLHSTYGVGGDAYLNIYNGNRTHLNIEQKKTEAGVRQLQLARSESEVKLQAALYYLSMQKSMIFRQLLASDMAIQRKQIEQIEQLRQNGVVLKSDLLRAQLQHSKQELTANTIDNDLLIANQRLGVLMGEPEGFRMQADTALAADTVHLAAYEDYLAEAFHHAFPGRISELETHLRELQVQSAKGLNAPTIGLFANYKLSYPQIMLYPYAPNLYGLGFAGIKASIPISGFYTNRHKIKGAEVNLQAQEAEHEDVLDKVRLDVNSAYLRLKEAMHRVEVAGENVRQARENARIVNNTYFNQTSLITDLLDANNALLQTRFELAAARIDVQIQYYQLQNAIGNL